LILFTKIVWQAPDFTYFNLSTSNIVEMGETWVQRELLTPRKLAFNVFFYGTHLFFFAYGWYSQATNQKLAALNGLKWSVWCSRGAGLVLAYDGGLILLPMLRNVIRVIRPKLAWLFPADENIWFHRQVAYSMAFWAMVHTTAHYVNFINVERTQVRKQTALQIHYTQPGGFTGHWMLFIMVLMYTTAHHKIRAQCFEAFWYTHHLAFFFMLGLYTHATGCFVRDSVDPDYIPTFPFYSTEHCLGYLSWRFIIWPGILYFGERMYREYRARRSTKLSKVLVHPSGAMELRILKPSFKYTAGQWLFIQVPDVSNFQWHPFTITSAPDDPYVSVHIRQVGDWTQALGERVGAGPAVVASMTKEAMKGKEKDDAIYGTRGDFVEIGGNKNLPAVRIDGPFGAPAEDVFNCEVAVLIGAGIGVTPFASILKDIWYRQQRGSTGILKRVEFFWVCRDAPSFGWFQSLLQEIEASQADPNFLRINIYLTQKIDDDMMWNIAMNDAGAAYDPLTLLRTRTMFGRPDWMSIYGHLRQAIEAGNYLPGSNSQLKTNVGTYFCGPSVLAKAIRTATTYHTCRNVNFTFAKEHF
jgi:NADPH oxidase